MPIKDNLETLQYKGVVNDGFYGDGYHTTQTTTESQWNSNYEHNIHQEVSH